MSVHNVQAMVLDEGFLFLVTSSFLLLAVMAPNLVAMAST